LFLTSCLWVFLLGILVLFCCCWMIHTHTLYTS
jgi:hypothetical protein